MLFRADRLAGIAREWDSWANWVPKSYSKNPPGRLDLDFLALSPQLGSYPPGPTMTQAAAFHAMGSADTVTLHVQYWFFAAAFVVAVIGLLSQRVHQAILFPLLLAFLVAPSFLDWVTTVYADVPMGYFVALSALLVFLWIDERKAWHLTAGTVFLSGAMLTKREGILFAACVLFAGFAASFADRRRLWPRLLAAGLAAYALVLPWTIWFTAQGLPATGFDTGYVGVVSSLDRVWPALADHARDAIRPRLVALRPVPGDRSDRPGSPGRGTASFAVRRSVPGRGGHSRDLDPLGQPLGSRSSTTTGRSVGSLGHSSWCSRC